MTLMIPGYSRRKKTDMDRLTKCKWRRPSLGMRGDMSCWGRRAVDVKRGFEERKKFVHVMR